MGKSFLKDLRLNPLIMGSEINFTYVVNISNTELHLSAGLVVGAKYTTMKKAQQVASQSSYLNGGNVPNGSSHNRSGECGLVLCWLRM